MNGFIVRPPEHAAARKGELAEIARLGGGKLESYPEEVTDRSVSGSLLHNLTVPLSERHGFERTLRIGKNRWIVTEVMAPRAGATPT